MLGIRAVRREDGIFSPAEAVFGSQPLLPGQFLDAQEPPTQPFLQEFQGLLAGCHPMLTSHNSKPAQEKLEELLLAQYILVWQDGITPPLMPLYDEPFLVLERSLGFFKLQMGDKSDHVSTLQLRTLQIAN